MSHAPSGAARTGLIRVIAGDAALPAGSMALCTNYTAVTADLRRGVDALIDSGADIRSLLSPEHGYWGAVQAGQSEGEGRDEATGLPILDTYLSAGEALDSLVYRAGADQILIDLQDIGTRFYTYMWTLYDLLCSAARTGLGVVVLDRPNPLGGQVAGPGLDPAASSFIGRVSIPLRHGLTLGELARWFNTVHVPEATGAQCALEVIEVSNWSRELQSPDLPWVMPSPNMPTWRTAVLYPGTGLLEGTTLSEGRGTTAPFELFGAAWTDSRFAAALRERSLPGVEVREAVFRPLFSKWAGETTHGAQLHLTDASAFDPIVTGWSVLDTVADLYPDQQLWRTPGEGRPPFIDLLWGSAALREGINSRSDLSTVLAESPPTPIVPEGVALYPEGRP